MTLNFIQDIPTPHNNVLVAEFKHFEEYHLNLWYGAEKIDRYNFPDDLTNKYFKARVYGLDKINWSLIKYFFKNRNEKFLIIGVANPTTKLLFFLGCLCRIPFNMWTDYPNDDNKRGLIKHIFREAFYLTLKLSKNKIFCVGKQTIQYFEKRGFDSKRLVNLPILIEVNKTKEDFKPQRSKIFKRYRIDEEIFVLAAGSRLVYDKGYDLLIKALALVAEKGSYKFKAVIVGKGEERQSLETLIGQLKLDNLIILEEWLDINDFRALIANANVFVHPARFDAFGGTIFAMALGIPVIGSRQAGAAVDRIEDGKNGFLYDAEDIEVLAKSIIKLYEDPNLVLEMGENARITAEKWTPSKGVELLMEQII